MMKTTVLTATFAAALVAGFAYAADADAATLRADVTAQRGASAPIVSADRFRDDRRDVRFPSNRRPRTNHPNAFGYENLSGNFVPRFNVTGRRVNSLLRY